jgi:hypothetical protein
MASRFAAWTGSRLLPNWRDEFGSGAKPRCQDLSGPFLLTGDEWTYEYNSGGQMNSAVETTSGSVVEQSLTYDYDIFGLLIEEDVTVGATTTVTRFAYDGWNPAKAGATGTSGYDVWADFNRNTRDSAGSRRACRVPLAFCKYTAAR